MSENTTNKIGLVNLPDMPESADNAIKNLTDAPTHNIGKTLADIWYLVFGPISHAADKKKMAYAADLEKYHQELTSSIDDIPKNKLVDPSMQVTAQALETSKYCVSSEVLRKMFVNLISGSMNSDTYSLAHPAFPEILKQLSSTDALLLKDIYRSEQSSFPIARIGIKDNSNGYNTLYENVFIPDTLHLSYIECSLSLSSLERANLVSINYNIRINFDPAYSKLRQTPEYFKAQEISGTSPYFCKGVLRLTSFGQSFCSICIGTY